MTRNIFKKPFRPDFYNVIPVLILINFAIFFLNGLIPVTRRLLAMNPVYVIKAKYYWQVFTYMFVHGNISHILFNMFALFLFGIQLERRMGSSEFLTFYLFSGLGAGLFSLFFYWITGMHYVFLLGASGAVYAVLLAYATYFPDSEIYIMGILPIKAPLLVSIYAVIELFSSLSARGGGVEHFTHLAGLIFAYLYFRIRIGLDPIKVFLGHDRSNWY